MKNGRVYLALLGFLAFGGSAWAQSPRRYPHELTQYPFYSSDPWQRIVPLVSTMADVRKLLGDPAEAGDLTKYGEPYPGDGEAAQPLFCYRRDPRWQVLIYFVGANLKDGINQYPAALRGRVVSVDFIPAEPLPFRQIELP